MKANGIFSALELRPRIIALVFIIPALACAGSPVTPYSKATESNTGLTSTAAQMIEKGIGLETSYPSTTPSIPPSPQSTELNKPSPDGNAPNNIGEVPPSRDIIQEMLEKVDLERALGDLKQLTGDVPVCIKKGCFTITKRLTGSEGLKWAEESVYERLTELGYIVELQDWSSSPWSDQNIIARKKGSVHPEESIYLIAHLDGAGSTGDFNYPAADDNASGVVGILELARVLADYSFSRTIVMLISTGEEQGTLGAKSYIKHLTSTEVGNIKYAINLDMIGYDANQDTIIEFWHGNQSQSIELANRMIEIVDTYRINIVPILVAGCG